MKFARNARIHRAQLDAAPFAGMFFCLLIFVLLASLVYTPGVHIQLPASTEPLPGIEGPTIAAAMDPTGQLYFRNQFISETNLYQELKSEVERHSGNSNTPLTLIVQADKAVTLEQLNHLRDLAYSAGVRQMSQQVLPRIFDSRKK